jgi:hypothetical protein
MTLNSSASPRQCNGEFSVLRENDRLSAPDAKGQTGELCGGQPP